MINYYNLIKELDDEFYKLEKEYRIKREKIVRLRNEHTISLIPNEVMELAILLHKRMSPYFYDRRPELYDLSKDWNCESNIYYIKTALDFLKCGSFEDARNILID